MLGALAIIAPGAVYAVTYTSVVITDPLTAKESLVDSGRRLYVYDPIAGYANNPLNFVEISGSGSHTQSVVFYTVPAGKALILKSASISYYNGAAGADNYAYFYAGTSANPNRNYITGFDDSSAANAHFPSFGSGFYAHSGDTLSFFSSVITQFSFQGYLVPASAVPAAGTAAAAEQMVQFGGPPIK